MKNHKKKGQMTVEMVLIMAIFIGLATLVKEHLFENPAIEDKLFYKFATGPWKSIAVMMESGVWMTDATEGRKNHPNQFKRVSVEKGIRLP